MTVKKEKVKKGSAQRAVWRKRGRGSSDTMCRTATSALVQTALESPACAKPLGRYLQAADSAADNETENG